MANENEQSGIEERLQRLQRKPGRMNRWKPWAIGAGTFTAGAALASYAFLTATDAPPQGTSLNLPTSQVTDFQDGSGLEGFTITRPRPEPQVPETPATRTETVEVVDQTRIDELAAQLEGLQLKLTEGDTAREELLAEMEQMKGDAALKDEALAEAEREMLRLQSQLETQDQLFGEQDAAAALEAQRRAEYEARRAEEEARRQAQIASPMVTYRASGGSETPEGGDARDYAAGDEFLRAGANKARVTQSEVIGSPSNTIIQGTLIEATLETAISSQLPGNVAANVSYDVWSMDMSQVLIPRGSKLYGRYNSQIERGQRRVMIAWDRLVTSDGQSVQLEGYGTDRIGRAGMTGKVNNHTLARFGSAAAVSIIGALPDIAVASIEENGGSETTRDTVESIGQDASDAIDNVMAEYLDIPATISVDQGAVVMVRVNTDLEMF
ncbi:conjugal transfer protein [Paracoccus sp. M683]|uniref:TrbI/VirB10 family protein n=1 Tax=Paracoccus sp. M683 TaxID=2594268 RepID=UPI00117BF1FB|nr:TrbI/VirB10 family protein [Paracoccus sp. M683]TRW94298.1 conjugal transfer protein [Paracoccus sp. M683]